MKWLIEKNLKNDRFLIWANVATEWRAKRNSPKKIYNNATLTLKYLKTIIFPVLHWYWLIHIKMYLNWSIRSENCITIRHSFIWYFCYFRKQLHIIIFFSCFVLSVFRKTKRKRFFKRRGNKACDFVQKTTIHKRNKNNNNINIKLKSQDYIVIIIYMMRINTIKSKERKKKQNI